MKKILLILFYLTLAFYVSCAEKKTVQNDLTPPKNYHLTVERGAFHYDSFIMTLDSLNYIKAANANFENKKYNQNSIIKLDSKKAITFFKEIENRSFWALKNDYISESSCTSTLKITLSIDTQTKTITCDDFERDCPELLKYIEKKVVELESRDLKRIYLPG